MADDYCVAVFERTNFFLALWDNYLHISDRYSNFILISLSEAISPRSVSLLPGFMILLWVLGLIWLLSEVTRLAQTTWRITTILCLSTLTVFLSLLQAPNLYQTLYWRSSMATHFAPLVLLSCFFAFLARCIYFPQSANQTRRLYLIIFFLSVLLGGFSEPVVILMLVILTCSMLVVWRIFGRSTKLSFLACAFLGAVTALSIMILAPANSLRLGSAPPGLLDLISRSFLYAYQFITQAIRILPLPIFINFVLPLLIFYRMYAFPAFILDKPQKRILVTILTVVPVFIYLLIVSSFAPSVYGQSFPVERARFAGQVCLVVGLMIEGAVTGVLLAQWRPKWLIKLPIQFILGIFLLFSAIYPLRATFRILMQTTEYQTRAKLWDLRDAYIKRHASIGEKDIMVPGYSGVYGIKELDDDPAHWVNICAASYYGVNSIRAVTIPEEYLLEALNE